MKILIAVDGSDYTKRMLAYWAANDDWLGNDHHYTLLTVVPAVPPRAAAVLDRALLQGYYADEGAHVFKPIKAFLDQRNVKATFESKTGAPADVIASKATEGQFDLLLMGSHGHSALVNLALGSIATKVLSACRLPVLLIR
jgi:nucleotide-binding universal stress UspA family protein